ncbi:transporter substrate-binding domain-containing protein [Pseudonocardia lacus]|uniref:transporter substrate-binding domain-containing protein n=1 Tax=Pseudonocardia lacus TaxID=2835865 RepID=UPI001BDD8D64|nr:transporter substrate-binding domain-containing protein [Pseudonocardia lacus]
MRHSVRVRRLAAVAFAVAVAGCGYSEPLPAVPAAPTAAAPLLHAALPKEVQDAGVLVFAADSHPPYRTIGPDGAITGIDKDIQDALSRVLGVRIEMEQVDGLPAALDGMLAGRFDAFNGPVKATEERERQFDSITWMTTHTSYVVPSGSSAGIAQADDLCGKRVAVVAGSVVESQLGRLSAFCQRGGSASATAVLLGDTQATLEAARSGRADAAGMTQAAAIEVATTQEGAFSYVTQTREQGAATDFLAMLVPKDEGLGPVMLKAFQQLFDDGTYADIIARYDLGDVTLPAPVFNVSSVTSSGAAQGPAQGR